jgi:hypothetical protein
MQKMLVSNSAHGYEYRVGIKIKFSFRRLKFAEYRRDKENCSHLGALGVQTVLKHLLQSIGRPLYYFTSCYPIHDHLYIKKRMF